jgi:hypothetical protein
VDDAAGRPVPKGTAVLWKDGKGAPTPFTDGKFVVALPSPGAYRVELKGPGFSKSSQELRVERGQVYRLNFTLKTGGMIKGRVMDAVGRPVQEGDVFYKDGNASYGVPIDRDGTYRIEGLAPGQYRVTVMAGDREVSRTVSVEAGKETVTDFVVK